MARRAAKVKTLTSATSSKVWRAGPGSPSGIGSAVGSGAGPVERGFTLIELLVVLAIMGVMVAIVPGAFSKMREGAQYRDTLRAITSDLRDARFRATATGQETEFRINLEARSFGIQGVSVRPIPEGLALKATVASKDISPNGVFAIRFLPQGGATGGNVEIARTGGGGARLKVDWLSGRVTQEALVP
jgi:general secretion pathway protein H